MVMKPSKLLQNTNKRKCYFVDNVYQYSPGYLHVKFRFVFKRNMQQALLKRILRQQEPHVCLGMLFAKMIS